MSKVLEDEKLISNYPGLVRSTQVFENNIIEIEFNIQYSNEIGIRFQKKFVDPKKENQLLQSYFDNTTYLDEKMEITNDLSQKSFIQLLVDTISDRVFLPDSGYSFFGDKANLKATIKRLDSKNND